VCAAARYTAAGLAGLGMAYCAIPVGSGQSGSGQSGSGQSGSGQSGQPCADLADTAVTLSRLERKQWAELVRQLH
jgi:hypothetical protein